MKVKDIVYSRVPFTRAYDNSVIPPGSAFFITEMNNQKICFKWINGFGNGNLMVTTDLNNANTYFIISSHLIFEL